MTEINLTKTLIVYLEELDFSDDLRDKSIRDQIEDLKKEINFFFNEYQV